MNKSIIFRCRFSILCISRLFIYIRIIMFVHFNNTSRHFGMIFSSEKA